MSVIRITFKLKVTASHRVLESSMFVVSLRDEVWGSPHTSFRSLVDETRLSTLCFAKIAKTGQPIGPKSSVVAITYRSLDRQGKIQGSLAA